INQAPAPKLWQPSNEVAHENTVKTVANAAFSSYEKFRDNSPIIVLENYQPDLVLGRASQLAKVVEETRKKFAQRLVNEKHIDRKKAEEAANKLIGVTWDVGHINFMKKAGYTEKEILQETKNIAPYVKQVHITDNFGFNDAHLPPGMGNAPIMEELKILEKAGFNFDKGNVIVEAGAYVGQMKENPQGYIMDYFNSPLYEYKAPFEAARPPYWPQIWEQEAIYGVGYGDTLPELHFKEFYGSSFSNLPKELGGQIGGDKSRFAGTPNQ
nr:sugar phosphate isomerase/epimerase [Candidatus Woesearchaeota archaeon]